MTSPIQLRLLGPVRAHRDGRPVHGFESRKALALLGYLAVRGAPLARAHLADLLWPDLPEARGRANLSGALHSIATCLPGCFTADRQIVAFHPSPAVWVDVIAFEAFAAQGTRDALAAAVDLYQGEFMADLVLDDCPDFEIWLVHRREEWCIRVAELLHVLINSHAEAREDAKAIAFLRRWLVLEPWREEAHSRLMTLLARTGQRSAALAQYEVCRRALHDELAVEPAAETTALYQRLRAGEMDGAAVDAAAASAKSMWAPQDRLLVVRGDPDHESSPPDSALESAVRQNGGMVALSAADLTTLARQPATDLHAYRLGRIAEWSQPRHRLDRHFIALTLLVDQGEATEERWRAQERRFDDLGELLGKVPEPAVVLLGPPGSGKTTLLRRLELDNAVAAVRGESPAVSYLVSLGRYPADGAGGGSPEPGAWLGRTWRERFPHLPDLDRLLVDGRMLLLLDGLNEMPHASFAEYREHVTLWKAFLAEAGRLGNRVVFTCRSLDYSAPLSTPSLRVPQVRIEPLTDEQIRRFLEVYSPKRSELIWRGLEATGQMDIVRTPYVLRLLIDHVRAEGEVSRGRAAMFTGFVRGALKREVERDNPLFRSEALLTEHDQLRVAQARRWRTPYELPERGPLFPRLSALAFGMQVGRRAGDGLQVRVTFDEALGLVAGDNGVADAGAGADAGTIAIAERILRAGEALGLLDDDVDPDDVRFRHQLLQEYFAARKLAAAADPELVRAPWRTVDIHPGVGELIATLPPAEPLPPLPNTGWEETAVLAVAMADDPEGFIRGVMATNLVLAGRCTHPPEVRERLGEGILSTLRWALAGRCRDAEADLRDRIAAGLALGSLGDPRFERWAGPHGAYLMPPLVEIPGGDYPIGEDEPIAWTAAGETGDPRAHMPRHMVAIAAFGIGQFPVTNAEWACFMAAGGYDDEQWWETADARAWRQGDLANEGAKRNARAWRRRLAEDPELFERMATEGRVANAEVLERWRRWMTLDDAGFEAAMDAQWRVKRETEPQFWHDERYNAPSQPVVGICWFEARAYCAWLGGQTGLPFRLPTEVEWEAAARGRGGRLFAYGDTFDATKGNTIETHVKRSTPVGVFVGGDTPEGVSDMMGNVAEWTSSGASRAAGKGAPGNRHRYGYPYDPNDGREDVHAGQDGPRVYRGGEWGTSRSFARAACRSGYHSNRRSLALGFRCCCGAPVHEVVGVDPAKNRRGDTHGRPGGPES